MSEISYGLKDKVALVTGASRGIGLEVAKHLLKDGAKVAICARKEEGLKAAAAELGEEALVVPAHIAKADQVEALFQAVQDKFGRLDILINNVGMNLMTASLADTDPGLWQKIIDSNLNGTFLCSRRAAQIMKEQGGGKIVTITSTAAHRAAPFMGVYGIAKAGMEMMTKVLAGELGQFNIQANAVAPAMVKTGFSQPFWSDQNLHDQIVANIPAGRLAETSDVVHPVLFLASSGADYINGQTLVVDGGATAI